MDEVGFRDFLNRSGRSESATNRCLDYVKVFERYLEEFRGGINLDSIDTEDLNAFVLWGKEKLKNKVKTHLWAIHHYYQYSSNKEIAHLASELRKKRIVKKPFSLKKFAGVNPEHVNKLSEVGIKTVQDILKAGKTPMDRRKLSVKTGVPLESLLEVVKLSDLARIPGIKGIRARLYYNAGIDTVEKMAEWQPKALRKMLVEFVERTGFNGMAPLQKEVEFSVEKAKNLSKVIEY